VVVKLPAEDPRAGSPVSRRACTNARFAFYREIAGEAGITTPACLYAEIDTASGAFALVLGDLAPAGAPTS